MTGVRSLDDADLAQPCGPAEGPYAEEPMTTLVLHINREVIHHGAEIALLRDLYAHTHHEGELTCPPCPHPIADERAGLTEYLAAQQYAFHALAFGLTDEQASATPTVSALSIGGLIKHVTSCQRGWMARVAAAPELLRRATSGRWRSRPPTTATSS